MHPAGGSNDTRALDNWGVALRVGVFIFLSLAGLMLLTSMLMPVAGYLYASVFSLFISAAIANGIALRIYERGRLADIGLGWTRASRRNLALGIAGGAGAALVVLAGPLVVGAARFEPVPNSHFLWRSLLFVSIGLLFGAVGEEMLFRGYAFQVLVGSLGPFATVLPVGIVFGLAHSSNQNASALAILNTVLWGILLGYSFLRSHDLWLPIGLHVGWNWMLPLFGVNLSGFTMGVTGYALRWNIGPLWSGGDYGPEAGLLTCGVIVILFFYLRKAPIVRQTAPLLREPPEALNASAP